MAYGTSPAMYVGTDGSGGYQVAEKLKEQAFLLPQPMSPFRAFLDLRENLGKNIGDTVFRTRWGDISTAGAEVAESSTIPTDRSAVLTQATATVSEFGNSISVHSKMVDLSNIDVTNPLVQTLRNDEAKMINTYLYSNVYDAAFLRYVGTASDGGAFTTDGTATATATSKLNSYHIKQMRKKLKGLFVPTMPNGRYVALLSLGAANNLRDDADWKNVQIYDTAYQGLVTGYMGTLHGVDLFEDDSGDYTDPHTNNSLSGEAFVLGQGFGTEDTVLPVEVRTNLGLATGMGSAADFGRKLEFAHYQAAAFGTLWNITAVRSHCIKWDSA